MPSNELLAAELRRCQAECTDVNAELLRIVASADPANIVELEEGIRAVLTQLKEAADRLHDAATALKDGINTRDK